MATATKIQIDTNHRPVYALPNLTKASAEKTSELLQKNHDDHHMYFNDRGFHNHIVHQLLALYALEATPENIQKGYDDNKSYQRKAIPTDRKIVQDMHDPAKWKHYLGKGQYFRDFLVFFQQEMEQKGWQAVVNEYLFQGDERADDLLARSMAGILHPFIHLGYGIEFQQPVIVAEGLAQAATHRTELNDFLARAEKASKEIGDASLTMEQIVRQMRADEKVRFSARYQDSERVRGGVLVRARDEMVGHVSKYVVKPDQLEQKTAENITFTVYCVGAAQRPPRIPKGDFFLLHSANSSIFLSVFLHAPWISTAAKARLLEYKTRTDLLLFVGTGLPELRKEEIRKYQPKRPLEDMAAVSRRITGYYDDGHTAKFMRAVGHAKEVGRKFEGKDGFLMEEDMWDKLAHLVVDSIEGLEDTREKWLFGCGFDEEWENVPLREGARL